MKKLNLGSVITPNELISKIESSPPVPLLWKGIKKGGLGFIFGPGKSGKTIICENLAYYMAARKNSFLGSQLHVRDEKILFISLEEPNIAKRGERNYKALSKFSAEDLELINQNLVIADDYEPRIWTDEQWEHLITDIEETNADVVIIDSLTHLYFGEIENSSFTQKLTKRIREVVDKLGITLIIVHHTPKLHGQPITIDSLAGSRILAQEAEFMIGVNKGANNKRYIKDVAYRYQREQDQVTLFEITEDFWIQQIKQVYESQLLREYDGRVDPSNRNQIFDFIKEASANDEDGVVTTAAIKDNFSDLGNTTVQEALNKLIDEEKIKREEIGKYIPI